MIKEAVRLALIGNSMYLHIVISKIRQLFIKRFICLQNLTFLQHRSNFIFGEEMQGCNAKPILSLAKVESITNAVKSILNCVQTTEGCGILLCDRLNSIDFCNLRTYH